MVKLKHYSVGSLEIYPIVCSQYFGGIRIWMAQNANQFLLGFNMAINKLENLILKDAEQGDLLPTALISKYDITLEKLMDVLNTLLNEGYLALTDGIWLRITEKGRESMTQKEDVDEDESCQWKFNYIKEFFNRCSMVQVNEPYLPSTESCMKIMEGKRYKETINEK